MEQTVKICRVIFPCFVNHHNTLFGGQALKWMDELAFIAVSKCFQKDFVTVKVEGVKFIKPVFLNDIIEFEAKVEQMGNVVIKVFVKGDIVERDYSSRAIEGFFYLAPVDNTMKPIRL